MNLPAVGCDELDGLWGLEFSKEVAEVHLVPAFGDVLTLDDHEGRAGHAGFFVGGGEAEVVTGMGHAYVPSGGYAVSFGEDVVEDDFLIRKGSAKGAVYGFKGFGADEDGVRFGEAMGFAAGAEHGVDGGFALLIPDLLKPATNELFVGFEKGFGRGFETGYGHGSPRVGGDKRSTGWR